MVKRTLGGGTMEIECDKGIKIIGVLSGRMKKNKIKVIIGDRA
jgi:translation initiation factor IF-1